MNKLLIVYVVYSRIQRRSAWTILFIFIMHPILSDCRSENNSISGGTIILIYRTADRWPGEKIMHKSRHVIYYTFALECKQWYGWKSFSPRVHKRCVQKIIATKSQYCYYNYCMYIYSSCLSAVWSIRSFLYTCRSYKSTPTDQIRLRPHRHDWTAVAWFDFYKKN